MNDKDKRKVDLHGQVFPSTSTHTSVRYTEKVIAKTQTKNQLCFKNIQIISKEKLAFFKKAKCVPRDVSLMRFATLDKFYTSVFPRKIR